MEVSLCLYIYIVCAAEFVTEQIEITLPCRIDPILKAHFKWECVHGNCGNLNVLVTVVSAICEITQVAYESYGGHDGIPVIYRRRLTFISEQDFGCWHGHVMGRTLLKDFYLRHSNVWDSQNNRKTQLEFEPNVSEFDFYTNNSFW